MKSILTPYLQIETMRDGLLEEKTGKEPEYVECQIVRKETGDEQRKTIKLSLSINDDDNDDVFCYCNGIESFKQLAEYGVGGFIVTFCWSFF
jgi:hypothetical protein